ncbi:transglutaminase-like domain-containing protein [Streptomyces oceani]|uniref:Protein SirB1 N-terminal domain-containing protein n=1 Tax=Streptomyces oceani TaxID=1075402 RepID=A0A1E7JJ27_9ACTN|nr:transglutaminase-like domain-containing protein [Streptomyces oceani]OEU87651.1 hypothetical protein AN216_25955 [Streptomyces oceani]
MTSNRERFRAAATEDRPDLVLLCLLIGAESTAYGAGAPLEESVVDETQIELDRLAGLLPASLRGGQGAATGGEPRAWAMALRRLLGEEYGFYGTPADYRRLDSSLLQAVLARRRGLPILLSLVWSEVARRAGAPVYGVALPGHYVVGFGDPGGEQVLADPFDGGRLLAEGEVESLLARHSGPSTPESRSPLRPADPLQTVLRVLNNIRAWAAARPEHSDVQLWSLELSLLLPHHPAELRRERARLLVERGEFIRGAEHLEEYADVIATMEPAAADALRREARSARARLN